MTAIVLGSAAKGPTEKPHIVARQQKGDYEVYRVHWLGLEATVGIGGVASRIGDSRQTQWYRAMRKIMATWETA